MNWEHKYDYEYPGPKLSPDTDAHAKLKEAILQRARRGRKLVNDNVDKWRELDHTLTAFVPAKDRESDSLFNMTAKKGAPLDIVVPVSLAALDVWTTYQAGVYLNNVNGMYQIQGKGGARGIIRAALNERFLATQSNWFDHPLKHIMNWKDQYKYGIGCMAPIWAKHRRREPVIAEVSDVLHELLRKSGMGVSAGDVVKYLEERVIHEGSELQNVDPYSLIIDPYATVNDYQKAEYIGWMRRSNIMDLLTREADQEERLFNCKYARDLCRTGSGKSQYWPVDKGRDDATGGDDGNLPPGVGDESDTNPCDEIHLMWKLIPSEWNLGNDDRPAIFEFTLIGDEVIVQGHQLDYDHGMYPLLFAAPTTSGYDFLPASGLAATYGMQRYVDFQFRSQIQNQAATLNNMFLYDPSAIEEDDMLNPGPGKLIRTKRALYGMGGVEQFVKQFQVQNVTGDNIPNATAMIALMNDILGTPEIMKGDMSGMPDRPTSAGLSMAKNTALSRLQTATHIMSSQQWYKCIDLLIANTRQFMGQDVMLSIIGSRFEQDLRRDLNLAEGESEVMYTPWDTDFDYDVVPVNNLQAQAELQAMDTFLERAMSIPEVSMAIFSEYNPAALFRERMRRAGFSNMSEYRAAGGQMPQISAQTMPDEQVAQQVQAGNLVPAGGAA